MKFLTEEFWHQDVIRTYDPRDFGTDKFEPNILTYLNIDSWTELAKLPFASRSIPTVVTLRKYGYAKGDTINMASELNFFSSLKDIKNDLIKCFDAPLDRYLTILIKGHIDKNTEFGINARGTFRYFSSEFGILESDQNYPEPSQVVVKDMRFGDNVHIVLFNIRNINFFSKIEKIELKFWFGDDFVITTPNKKINFSSTKQATLLG
jgi:hypothetical protein